MNKDLYIYTVTLVLSQLLENKLTPMNHFAVTRFWKLGICNSKGKTLNLLLDALINFLLIITTMRLFFVAESGP